MVEEGRRPSVGKIEGIEKVSLLDVRRFLGDKRSDAAEELMSRLKGLESQGQFSPELGGMIIDIARKHNVVSAERLIENCDSLWQDPKFKFNEYSELVHKAYQRFGSRAAGYFSLSYGSIFNLGVPPRDYFDWVAGAVDAGGKIYASWYAYGLPDVLKENGDPLEFRSTASRVYRRGGLKVAIPFILNAPQVVGEKKIGLQDFTHMSLEAIETLGKETSAEVVRNMVGLDNLGYEAKQFLLDAQKLSDEKGGKAAFWFAAGFTDLLKYKNEDLKGLRSSLERVYDSREYIESLRSMSLLDLVKAYEDSEKSRIKRLEQLAKVDTDFNPLDFGKEYVKLLGSIGKNAATFYAFSAKKWDINRYELPEQLDYFKLIPDKIIELRSKVSKKVFNSAMWFILKMGHGPKTVVKHLEDTTIKFEEIGENETMKILAYTAGIGRRGGRPFGLEYPKPSSTGICTHPTELLTEGNWANLLKWSDVGIAEEQGYLNG